MIKKLEEAIGFTYPVLALILLLTVLGMMMVSSGCANQTSPAARSAIENQGPHQPNAQDTRNYFIAGDYVEGSGQISSTQPAILDGDVPPGTGGNSAGGSAASGYVRGGSGGIKSGRNTQIAVNWNDASAKSSPGGITQTPQTGDVDQRGDARQRVEPDIQASLNANVGPNPSSATTMNMAARGGQVSAGPVTQDQRGTRAATWLTEQMGSNNPVVAAFAQELMKLLQSDGLIPTGTAPSQ